MKRGFTEKEIEELINEDFAKCKGKRYLKSERTDLPELTINVLRGADAIGENLIEVLGHGQKILLECGIPLSPKEDTTTTEEYVRKERYSAVVVTHFHLDHSGLLKYPLAAEKIYMGEKTFLFLLDRKAICEENAAKVAFMQSEETFFIGCVGFTPHLADHSAFDSYMIEFSDGEKTVIYTRDFRSNGRKSFRALLSKLPCEIDLLLCEKTIDSPKNTTEWELEKKAAAILREHKEVFIVQSATNYDRLVTFYRACKKTKTPLLLSPINIQVVRYNDNAINPKDYEYAYEYFPTKRSPAEHDLEKRKYGDKLIGREQIAALDRFAMVVNMRSEGYLQKLSEARDLSDAVLIYSMWPGYKQEEEAFFQKLRDLGITVVDLHASGHADNGAIQALIERTHPKEITYVHTEKQNKEKIGMIVFDTDDYLRTYKGKRSFVEGSPYFETFLKSLENLDLYDKIRFCNDVLQIPPIYTFVKYYKDVFTTELSTTEKQGLGACFAYLFQKMWGYQKPIAVWVGEKKTNIKNASYYLKREDMSVIHVENALEKLRVLAEKKLAERGAPEQAKRRLDEELAVIEKTHSAEAFLFMGEETRWLREKEIFFSARSTFYPTFYCSYLLGITGFDPMRCGVSYRKDFRVRSWDLDVECEGYKAFEKHLARKYGENIVAGPFSINLLKLPVLDEIKQAERKSGKSVDYGDFSDEAVYLAMRERQFTPPMFPLEIIRKKQPHDLRSLVECLHPMIGLTEQNVGHHICYAALYYKIAYLSK